MLRVAMISYHTCPLATLGGKDTGGMNVYVRELTRCLGQSGVHVDVFTRSQDEHVPHVLHDLGHGNRVVHVPAGPEMPLPKKELATYIPQFVAGIEKFAAEKNIHYDLIHSHYWTSGIAASQLKTAWKIPIVHMYHTLVLMKNRIARDQREIEGEYRVKGEKQVLHIADRIIAATPAEQAQLEFLYHADSRKLVVIPPGVDTSHFYPISADEAKAFIGMPTDSNLLLFVGRIEPLKGIDTLIRAMAILALKGIFDQYPHFLVIIGGDPEAQHQDMDAEMARLKILCGELGICDQLIFLGKRSQDTLPYYYSSAEVLIMPSHYESFGMVALEAMACGIPVVASQVGGLAFLVQDGMTGYVVPDDEPQVLAERLIQLITNPQLRQQLGRQACEYAQEYDWQKVTERIIKVYQEVISNQAVN